MRDDTTNGCVVDYPGARGFSQILGYGLFGDSTFLGNYLSTPPLSQHQHIFFAPATQATYFSPRAKFWLRGGAGGQLMICFFLPRSFENGHLEVG